MSAGATIEKASPARAPDPRPRPLRTELLRWAPVAVVALVALLPLRGLWYAPGPPMEEGFMLVFPELVAEGKVPNEDFLHLYGPGSLWVLAGAYELLGTTLQVERLVGYAQLLGVIFAVFALARPWGRWVAAGGAVLTAIVIIPPVGLTALAWTGGIALATWAVVAGNAALVTAATAARRRHALLIASGLLGGAALLYRPDLILAVGTPALVVFLGIDRLGRRRLALAFAAGLSPYLVHVAMAGASNAFRGMFIEPVFDLREGRRLPLPPSWSSFDGFLQRAGVLIEPPWSLPAPPSPGQLSIWLLLLVATNFALVALGIVALRRDGDRRLLAMALLTTFLLPQALQRPDSTHLAWASCVSIGLMPLAVVELLRQRQVLSHVWRTVFAVTVPVLLTLALIPHFTWRSYTDVVSEGFGDRREVHKIQRGDRIFYYGRADAARAVRALIPDVEVAATPGDSLFVGTGDLRKTPLSEAYLYYLFPELEPATRYIEMDPGVANAPDSGLADEVASADIVILSSIRDDWDEPNASRDFGPNEPNEVLDREFCLIGSYEDGLSGRGLFELFVKC